MGTITIQPTTALAIVIGMGMSFTFGLLFSPSPATGYPATTVNLGSNPIISQGGAFSNDGTVDLFTTYNNTDVVITDVIFSMSLDNTNGCLNSYVGSFILSNGTKVAELAVGSNNPNWASGNLSPYAPVQMSSGIRIPAGETLTLHMNQRYITGCGDAQVHYTVSGYQATP